MSVLALKEKNAKSISKEIIELCNVFSGYEPGDDTTCVIIKIRDIEKVTLFTGPPKNSENDKLVVNKLKYAYGKKVICGGSAANIYSRITNNEIITDITNLDNKVPPYAKIEGVDLVTEGVLTINRTVQIIESYLAGGSNELNLKENNGASKLADILINHCTHLDILMGNAINPAHQNPYFPDDLNIKWKSTNSLAEAVRKLGKEVVFTKY